MLYKTLFAVVFFVLLMVSCGNDAKQSADVTSTTTTTQAPPPAAPLTGLPEPDESKRNLPLLTIKIDNHPQARPQFGVDKADSIVEERVEGGLTRLLALFQTNESDKVGPVRSLRSTDAAWLKPLGGMIAYSGGIDPVKAMLPKNGIVDLGADSHGAKYYKRRSDRTYEHSMYTITPVLRELTPKNEPAAKALYQYLDAGQSFTGAGAVAVAGLSGDVGGGPSPTSFDWAWDGASSLFKRSTDGKAHEFEGTGQIGMDNVILQFSEYRRTQWKDRANTPVDEAVVVGEGDAWVLSGGQLVKGRWSRSDSDSITSFKDSAGATIKLKPGHTWLMLIPTGQNITVR